MLKRLVPKPVKDRIRSAVAPAIVVPPEYRLMAEDRRRLEGMRILVTGATGAIGSATAHRLLAEGAVVGACGRNREKLDSLCDGFRREDIAKDGQVIPVLLDVTDDISVRSGVDAFASAAGGIDALVNNAGGSARDWGTTFAERDFSVAESVLDVNLRGSMLCAHEVARLLVGQGTGGRIVNMSSVMGIAGARGACDYAAAKAGIIGFTKSLAIELGREGITVNCVSPGMVDQTPGAYTRFERPTDGNRLGRYGCPDEVARLVAYLLSPDADYITGQNIVIDGGRTLGLAGSR